MTNIKTNIDSDFLFLTLGKTKICKCKQCKATKKNSPHRKKIKRMLNKKRRREFDGFLNYWWA